MRGEDRPDLGLYILAAHTPIPVADTLEWARWFATHPAERTVKQEMIGNVFVSTVFLGIDHNHSRFFTSPADPNARPLLFETMAFFGIRPASKSLDICERCSTWEEAEVQHEKVAASVRKAVVG